MSGAVPGVTAPVIDLMLKLERDIHRDGWDQPPRLHAIKRHHNMLSLTAPMPVNWRGNGGVILEHIAQRMAEPDEWGDLVARSLALVDGFDGMLFAYEGWANDILPSEVAGRSLADIPGSKELRGVTVYDVRGRVFIASRVRGEAPTAKEIHTMSGGVSAALLAMVRAVATHLPDEAVDREALAAVKLLTEAEVEALIRAER